MSDIAMTDRLHAFVQDHPDGWNHEHWLGLLGALEGEGVDVSDQEHIGLALERARLETTLRAKGVQGLGPKRIQAVVEKFETLWNLRHASAEEIAEIPTVPAALARKVQEAFN